MAKGIIKEVRVRGKVSMKGEWWKPEFQKEDSTGENDFKVTLEKGGRREYFCRIDRVGGNDYGFNFWGISFDDTKIGPNEEYKSEDDLISRFLYTLNRKDQIEVNSFSNPYPAFTGGLSRLVDGNVLEIKNFIPYYNEKIGLTGPAADTKFFEVVQSPFTQSVPPFPDGYFKIWNDWNSDYKKWKEDVEKAKKTQSPTPESSIDNKNQDLGNTANEVDLSKSYVFNVTETDILKSKDFGTFSLMGLGEIGSEYVFIEEEVVLDEEYGEVDFAGSEEQALEGASYSVGQEVLVNLDTDSALKKVEEEDKDENKPPSVDRPTVQAKSKNGISEDPFYSDPKADPIHKAKGKLKRMLEVAKGELAYTELAMDPPTKDGPNPGKNTKYGRYWGINGHHYCGMFVNWCCEQAGMQVTKKSNSATKADGNIPNVIYCPTGVEIFKKNNAWLSNGENKKERENSKVVPEPGDIVFFSWKWDKMANHVGMVVQDMGDGTVKCYEGNTAPGKAGANQPGAGVWERIRSKSVILGYGKSAQFDASNTEPFTEKAGRAKKQKKAT